MDGLDDLALFAQVIEAGGFSAASRSTRIPKSRLSRRVGQLEERLGVRLIQRNARSFAVTAIGEIVYEHAQKMMIEADAVHAAVTEVMAEPSGTVRVTTSVIVGELVLAGLIAEFMLMHPKVKVVLNLTDRIVDLTAERFDLAIRASSGPLTDSSLMTRRLASARIIAVASPSLLETYGMPKRPQDLIGAPRIAFGSLDQELRKWQFQNPDSGELVEIGLEPRLIVDNLIAGAHAAAKGLAFAYLPDFTCRDELADGSLIEILSDWSLPPSSIYAVYPSRRGITSATRMLIDFLAERHGRK